jgi:hypothetical protein
VSHRRFAFVVAPVAVAAFVLAFAFALEPGLGRRPVGLAAYLGWRDARTPELAAREARVVQHRIAACMGTLGLPYREFVDPPPAIPDADLGPREWAAKWGFGVSTSVGFVNAMPPATDPNLAYIDSLVPSDRETYRAALFGSATKPGCNGQANALVYGRHDRLLAGLAPDLARLEDQVVGDARSVEADAGWMACIATESFRPSGRRRFGQEAIDLLTRRLEAIMGPPPGDPDVDRSALAGLQTFEIKLALRGIDCDEQVRAVTEAVRLEAESRFVDAHRAALDDIKAQAIRLDVELGLAPGESPNPVSFEP